jgi:hypothetical protein
MITRRMSVVETMPFTAWPCPSLLQRAAAYHLDGFEDLRE